MVKRSCVCDKVVEVLTLNARVMALVFLFEEGKCFGIA